jgi:ribulose 1,5-bisphosphate synthetase/thiazole synthase
LKDERRTASIKQEGLLARNWKITMNTPILIIGAGPVGMTMGCELARYGVPVRIIDKAAHRTDKSKALVVWSRTL